MRKNIWRWIPLIVLVLTAPLLAGERTGILAPPDVQKEQNDIMKMLIDGNKRHMSHLVVKSGLPKVMVVSCADSRVPPEAVFNLPPGELYTNRAFGNIVDKVILGSLEYGAETLKCRVLVVMGHTDCSAIKDAIREHDHPTTYWRSMNLQELNDQLEPAVAQVEEQAQEDEAHGAAPLTGDALVEAVVKTNVLHTMEAIREQSPLIWHLEQDDMIKIVGAIYHLDTGKVEWLQE